MVTVDLELFLGRCGSTLFGAMVGQLQEFQVLNEPTGFGALLFYAREKGWDISDDNKDLVMMSRNVLLLTAPDLNKKYYIKTAGVVIFLLPVLHAALPKAHETFIFRALKSTANSFKKTWYAIGAITGLTAETFARKLTVSFSLTGNEDYPIPWKKDLAKYLDYFIVHFTLLKVWEFQKAATWRKYFTAYRYEDLLKHKEKLCRQYTEELGVSEDRAESLLKGMEKDSHGYNPLNSEKIRNTPIVPISEESLEWGKMVASKLGIIIDKEDYQFMNINCVAQF